jgi:hypothetical protein
MRTFEHRFHFALTLVGLLLSGQSLPCEPPAGFVNPPRPDIASLEELLTHTEEIEIARSLADVVQAGNRPLSQGIRPTAGMPGVSGTFRLTSEDYGTVGGRRLVCLDDGSFTLEEVLHREVHDERRVFRYAVWNYTRPTFRDVHYAIGEFIHTQPEPNKTHIRWTYRFALKEGRDPEAFRSFLDTTFAEWMRTLLARGRANAEAAPAAQ